MEIRELLFSLPKIQEDQEKKNPLGEYAGTIRVTLTMARCEGEKTVPVFSTDSAVCTNNQNSKLYHLSKKDIPHHRGDAVGNIVSREGRSTRNVTNTGKFRNLKKYVPTPYLLEELVLHYRPRIFSHAPKKTVVLSIKQEVGGEAEKHRAPLNEVSNTVGERSPVKSQSDENKAAESAGEQLTQHLLNMAIESSEENKASSGDADMMETEDAKIGIPESLPKPDGSSGWQTERRVSLVPMKKIKYRESCASAMIPPEKIKHRDSCASAMIPLEKIKHRESCASAMIPPEKIKHRESCAFMMIPPEKIKHRESCASAMIPPEQVKQQPETVRMTKTEKKEILEMMDEFALIDESDSDDVEICMNDVEDDSILYMGVKDDSEGEDDFEGDSIIYMGDDDCCVLEVSNHMSFVEIDDTMIDTQ